MESHLSLTLSLSLCVCVSECEKFVGSPLAKKFLFWVERERERKKLPPFSSSPVKRGGVIAFSVIANSNRKERRRRRRRRKRRRRRRRNPSLEKKGKSLSLSLLLAPTHSLVQPKLFRFIFSSLFLSSLSFSTHSLSEEEESVEKKKRV